MLARLDDRIVPTTLPAGFAETQLAAGLDQPTGMAVAPDGRVFVTEQTGDVRVIKNGTLLATPFLTLGVDGTGERGLIGIALDPNFENNGFVYVYYTMRSNGTVPAHNRISRFAARGDVASPGETVLFDLDPLSNATNHNGGGMVFGLDGKLYVGVGDNGNGSNSQTANSLLGKILRLNPDGSIPSDNPTGYAGIGEPPTGKDRAIWAVGLRNPFALAVQPDTGRIFINDVGEGSFEEIDQGAAGENYGWPFTEGDFDPAQFPAFTRPIYAYAHGTGSPLVGAAITGGTFYNPASASFPAGFVGNYLFTDLEGGWINRLDPQTHAVTNFATNLTGQLPVALAVDPQGNLLYLAHGANADQGGLFEITSTGGGTPTSGFATAGVPIVAAGAGAGGGAAVAVFNPITGQQTGQFFAFNPEFTGGVRVATGDVNGDGVPDLVVSAGAGGGPRIAVFNGRDIAAGSASPARLGADFFAFESALRNGAYVAAADLDGDGRADIIAGAGPGGAPRVTGFSGSNFLTGLPTVMTDFFAGNMSDRSGVTVTTADADGDGKPDIFTGGANGRVAVFRVVGGPPVGVREFTPFNGFTGGVFVG
jgi:glucose/arabinose dehydrogenase